MKKSALQLFVTTSCVLAPVSAWAYTGAHDLMGFASGFNHPMSGADQHRKSDAFGRRCDNAWRHLPGY